MALKDALTCNQTSSSCFTKPHGQPSAKARKPSWCSPLTVGAVVHSQSLTMNPKFLHGTYKL